MAEELGLSYEHKPIGPRTGETRTREYTELNPKQKIPFMKDGSVSLSESIAICRYLLDAYGKDSSLYQPATAAKRAEEDEWICYVYGELDETSLYVMRRHRDLNEIYGDAPAAVESSRDYALKHLAIVDRHMSSNNFVMGREFGLADIILASTLDWAHVYGFDLTDALVRYRHKISDRPAYQRAYAVNYPKAAVSKTSRNTS